MIKLETSKQNFYFCTSANWSTVVLAEDKNQACQLALDSSIKFLNKKAEVSPCIRVKKVKEKFEDSDSLVKIDKVFADLGMYEQSKTISEIIKNITK